MPIGLGTTIIGGTEFRWGERTYVIGVINATTDSFSGDGVGYDADAAQDLAFRFQEEGADIVDVGGESTRPRHTYGADPAVPVTEEEELRRVLPIIKRLAGKLRIPISVDTYKASVAERALEAGASMINDVWGLKADPRMATVAAQNGAPIVLVHNQEATSYYDLVPQVIAGLRTIMERALESGIDRHNLIVDPGIGFGKSVRQNLEILRRLEEFKVLGRPILVGMSRKSTIGAVLGLPPNQRVEGTAATVALSIAKGADIVRVHDVKEMVRVARMSDAILRGWSGP